MGGLSHKKIGNCCPSLLWIIQLHLKSFLKFHLNLKVEASHNIQKHDQTIFAFTQQSNSNIVDFLVDYF